MFTADFILRDNSEHSQLLAYPLSSSGVLHAACESYTYLLCMPLELTIHSPPASVRRAATPIGFDHSTTPIRPITTKFEPTIDDEVDNDLLRYRVQRPFTRHQIWLDTDGVRKSWAELAMVRARLVMVEYLSMQVD